VQRRRVDFHEYVPLFFAGNTPMLYVVFENEIVMLEIDTTVLKIKGCLISDGNIAANKTIISDNLDDLDGIDWEMIYSSIPTYSKEYKRKRSAEVLVPDFVEAKFIQKIHCKNSQTERTMKNILKSYGIEIPTTTTLTREGVSKYEPLRI
jgi:hypothetical protein